MTREIARPSAPARTPPGGPAIRRVGTLAEYHECVAIQQETWGADFTEYVPAIILQVAQKIGGVVAGAFAEDGRMLGFVFGLAGVIDGRPVHWSDMLAVRPEARGARIGEHLKRYQQHLARAAGAEAMYWTFDPLVARNAHLNLARLGARAVEYVPNMYGDNTSSPLHAGLPTDRLVAKWDLVPGDGMLGDGVSGDGAADLVARHADAVITIAAPEGMPTFAAATAPDVPLVRIAVPREFHELPPVLRAAWRTATREAFLTYLRRGYAVTAFRRASGSDLPYYELERAARPSVAPPITPSSHEILR